METLHTGRTSLQEKVQDQADMYDFTAGEFEALALKIESVSYKTS
jgi:hypothetical protein